MADFNIFPLENFIENPFNLIGNEGMLVTAGDLNSFNTMTAAWGGLGYLWNKNVVYIFIRPSRYTYSFLEKFPFFTLSFFEEKYRSALQFCGSHSGRNTDKIKETGLHPIEGENDVVYFSEAKLVLICKKIYSTDIDPDLFIDQSIMAYYAHKDFHRLYIAEIVSCLKKGG